MIWRILSYKEQVFKFYNFELKILNPRLINHINISLLKRTQNTISQSTWQYLFVTYNTYICIDQI